MREIRALQYPKIRLARFGGAAIALLIAAAAPFARAAAQSTTDSTAQATASVTVPADTSSGFSRAK